MHINGIENDFHWGYSARSSSVTRPRSTERRTFIPRAEGASPKDADGAFQLCAVEMWMCLIHRYKVWMCKNCISKIFDDMPMLNLLLSSPHPHSPFQKELWICISVDFSSSPTVPAKLNLKGDEKYDVKKARNWSQCTNCGSPSTPSTLMGVISDQAEVLKSSWLLGPAGN